MIHINLLPSRASQKKDKMRGQLLALLLALIFTAGACGVVYSSLQNQVDDMKAEIARKEQRLQSLKKTLGEVAEFKKKKDELVGKLNVLDQLKQAKGGPVHLLDQLSLSLSEKLWLTSFKEAGGAITLSGLAFNEEMVAQFLKNLEASPNYKNVELQVIEQANQSGVRVNKFNVVAKVEASAAKPVQR